MSGVEPLLDALCSLRHVASTGKPAKLNFTLGHTGQLPRLARRLFTTEDVLEPKPAPDLLLRAAPGRAPLVEDTATGVLPAQAAGMPAIGHAAMGAAADLLAADADAVGATMDEVRRLLQT